MPYTIDETHDPNLESWVESANDPETDFPIQNLPLASDGFGTVYTRLGDSAVNLNELAKRGALKKTFGPDDDMLILSRRTRERPWMMGSIRAELCELFSSSGPNLDDKRELAKPAVMKLVDKFSFKADHYGDLQDPDDDQQLERRSLDLPMERLGDYTDFYASVFHATNVGSMFRPDNPLLPNYKWIPVGYHGRASSVVPSGTPIRRPHGQQAPAEEGGAPGFGPCKMLDYELELGVVMGRGNELGSTIPIGEAEDHILGLCLLNDWSARDMQKWEYQPLGPFLAKSFATSVSPYLVTMEALAPFRSPAMPRPEGDPNPLPHLYDEHDQKLGGIDITLEVLIASKQMRDKNIAPVRLSKGSFKDMYWTIAQMVTHHASNGCNMQPGDLLGSGTISGPTRDSRGCLLELTWDGDPFASPPKLVPGTQRTPITLPTGEERKFLADGDEVIIRGSCERDGFRRIGFGECRGIIEPSLG